MNNCFELFLSRIPHQVRNDTHTAQNDTAFYLIFVSRFLPISSLIELLLRNPISFLSSSLSFLPSTVSFLRKQESDLQTTSSQIPCQARNDMFLSSQLCHSRESGNLGYSRVSAQIPCQARNDTFV